MYNKTGPLLVLAFACGTFSLVVMAAAFATDAPLVRQALVVQGAASKGIFAALAS